MTPRKLALALGLIAAASPLSAANPDRDRPAAAPPGTIETRYCMRIEAFTGTLVARTRCLTRQQWTEQGVDVDRDWPKEGVRTIG